MRVPALALVLAACGAAHKPAPAPGPAAPPAAAAPGSFSLLVVVDRSGSMMGEKLELAKEAARRAAATLNPADRFGVISFDAEAQVALPLGAGDSARVEEGIAAIQPGGGTQYLPALEATRAQLAGVSGVRHVIFLSDGQAAYDGVEELAAALRSDGVTLSTIAIGDADENLLRLMSEIGGGRFYAALPADLPELFAKEAALARR